MEYKENVYKITEQQLEKLNQFITYWKYHLKDVDRLKGFMLDDLQSVSKILYNVSNNWCGYDELDYVKYLDYVLEDDDTEFGGIAFNGETLRDFVEEYNNNNITLKLCNLNEVNNELMACGIKPIKEVC